jgi:TonB family protein
LGFGKIRTKPIVKTNGVHQLWKTSDLPWSIFVRYNFKRFDMKLGYFSILLFFVFHLQTVAQDYAPVDTSHYQTLTKNVYKALKQENRKFLEPHIMNAEAFIEVITEYSKHVQGVTPEMVMRELSDPKKTAEITTMLNQKIQEKYHTALADLVDYGFNMEASHYIDHQIDPDREGYMWTYDVLFRIADDKDTMTIKLKSCIHHKKDWYITEGIKVKRNYKPSPQMLESTEDYGYPYEHQKIEVVDPYVEEIPIESDTPVEPMEDVPGPVMEEYHPNMNDTSVVYEMVEQMAVYPVDLREEVARKIQYPQYEKEMGIQGTLYTQFVIERNGSISEIKILRNVPGSKNFEKEALRILKSLDHRFQPAMHNGKKVRCRFTLPIKFVLQ